MYKRFLMLVALIVLYGCSSFSHAQAQIEEWGFYINDFFVAVEKGSLKKNDQPFVEKQWRDRKSPLEDFKSEYSGKGSILIHAKKVRVTFEDVKLSKLPLDSVFVPENKFKAVSGVVRGQQPPITQPFKPKFIKYFLNGFEVKINIRSIHITVKSATAAVRVRHSSSTFYTATANSLILKSDLCNFTPTGAISAKNFHGSTAFDLKDSVYRLQLKQADDQIVRLGKFLSDGQVGPGSTPSITPKQLIELKGLASRDQVELFSFTCRIKPEQKQAFFSLKLLAPMQRLPELEYILYLHSGEVEYLYNQSGLQSCKGSFEANIKLPDTIRDEANNEIELSNIILQTDQTGALFNNVNLPHKIKTGYSDISQPNSHVFLIEPEKDYTLVYFPVWHKETQNSTYSVKGEHPCEDHFDFLDPPGEIPTDELWLNAHKRPGLSVLRGILHFKSPQATFRVDKPESPFNLKTPFWGAVTSTPWGITGQLKSTGSFIPSNQDIGESYVPVHSHQYTLYEIIDLGNTRPVEPEERFSLAGFRILEMQTDNLRLCKNELEDSSFRYTIHFPFPSFIDLEFEDTSLDKFGAFNEAYGPNAPFSHMLSSRPSPEAMDQISMRPPKEIIYNPVSKILFAWRLPVAFAHRGVIIQYQQPDKPAAKVIMSPFDASDKKIKSSELKIMPLYSKHSDLEFGIRFKGTFDTDGFFELLDWDREPVFATTYPRPDKEMSMGFAAQCQQLTLADWASNPGARNFDFQWDGKIKFAFFDWQTSKFLVKDFVPEKRLPSSLSGSSTSVNGGDGLEIQILELTYSPNSMTPFSSRKLEVHKIISGKRIKIDALSFQSASYLNSTVYLDFRDGIIPSVDIEGRDNIKLVNAIPSAFIKDLVCYDPEAFDWRRQYNIADTCPEEYLIGTLQVKSPEGTVIISAQNTKYVSGMSPDKFDLQASKMEILSDETESINYMVIGVPSGQLALSTEGIEGAFGATFTPLAMLLPYEGVFRFFIDDKEGYFYIQMAGSFTYVLTFRGELFIVHAPYKKLLAPPPFFGVTNIIEDLALRALFRTGGKFKMATKLDQVPLNSIISGFFTAGNAQFKVDFIELISGLKMAAGPGLYFFNYKENGDSINEIGTFVNASLSVDFAILSAYTTTLLLGEISSDEFFARGNLVLGACANGFVYHCEAYLEGDLEFSSESGFDFSESEATAHCDSGGCD